MIERVPNRRIGKSILSFIIPIGIVTSLLIVIISFSLYFRGYIRTAEQHVLRNSELIGSQISAELSHAVYASEYLANSFSTIDGRRVHVNSLLQVVLLQNDKFEGVYTIWEPNEFDQMDSAFIGLDGHDDTGRFMPYWTRDEFGTVALQASLDYESSIVGDYYTIPKRTLEKAIINPFLYSSRGKDEYMIAAVCPIKYGKNFYGITGVNMKLSTFQKMVRAHTDELDNYDVRIVSGSGDYVASNADVSLLGQNLADIESNSAEQLNDMVKAQRNVALEDDYIVAQVPIRFNTLPVVWMVKTKVPLSAILGEDDILRFLMILLGSLVLAFLVNFAIYFYIKSKTETLDNLYLNALAFSQGEEPRYLVKSEDESRFINDIVVETYSFMKQAEQVFVQVQEGDYKADFMPRNPRDSFAKKLNLMLEILHQRQTDNREKQRIAQDERWIRNGIAVINKVVRRQYNQYTELTENLITQVVDYLNINQGGIFVLIESETGKFTLELTSSYAYSKLKAYKKRVYLGDGIVGTCALEREITYLTEIPNDYSQIRSGVGGALPKAVLVAPLIHENVVYGVIELATFTFFNETEIEFIRAIAEPIAAAIASVKIADKTRELLDAMQLQQSELKDQEANMRSSLEKLEEIQRKAKLTEDRLRRELESAKLEILRLKTSTIVFDSNE